MKNKRTLLLTVVLLVLIIGVAAIAYNSLADKGQDLLGQEASSVAQSGEEQKQKALDATVYDLDGNAVKLSDFYGKPIVLNFWASWCPPCKEEMPAFEKLYQEKGGEIQFLMVDMVDGSQETLEKGSSYVEEQGFTFPVYYDTDMDMAYQYGVTSLPTTLLIDSDGYIVGYQKGAISEEILRTAIEERLA